MHSLQGSLRRRCVPESASSNARCAGRVARLTTVAVAAIGMFATGVAAAKAQHDTAHAKKAVKHHATVTPQARPESAPARPGEASAESSPTGHVQQGVGSWYGGMFHGRQTASGELFNMHAYTAAHRTLPIPSFARVRNLANGREVIVRINDRGPYAGHRIIDLSMAAAQKLGLNGVGQVRIEPIPVEAIHSGQWRVEDIRPSTPRGLTAPPATVRAAEAAIDTKVPRPADADLAATTPAAAGPTQDEEAAANVVPATLAEADHAEVGIASVHVTKKPARPRTVTAPTTVAATAERDTPASAATATVTTEPPATGPTDPVVTASTDIPAATAVAPVLAQTPLPATAAAPSSRLANVAANVVAPVINTITRSATSVKDTVVGLVTPRSAGKPGQVQIDPARTSNGRGWWLQLGAFDQSANAMRFQHKVIEVAPWLSPLLGIFDEKGEQKLQAGPYASREQAQTALERARDALKLNPVMVQRR